MSGKEQILGNRIESHIERVPECGCWIWMGSLTEKGYGRIWSKGKIRPAHRVVYEEYTGEMADPLHVLHSCDTPACVNPHHLFVGTNLDNVVDREKKRRGKLPDNGGERNGRGRLTQDQVLEIRWMAGTHQAIADQFGISRSHVGEIKSMKTWRCT